jgi:hypothetical protein
LSDILWAVLLIPGTLSLLSQNSVVCLDEQIKKWKCFILYARYVPSSRWFQEMNTIFHLSCIQNCSPIVLEKQQDVFIFSIMAVKRWNETALHLLLELCSPCPQISTAKVEVAQVSESSRGKEPEIKLHAHKGFTSNLHPTPPQFVCGVGWREIEIVHSPNLSLRLEKHEGSPSQDVSMLRYNSRNIKVHKRATNSQVLFPWRQQVNQQPRNHHKTPIIKQNSP